MTSLRASSVDAARERRDVKQALEDAVARVGSPAKFPGGRQDAVYHYPSLVEQLRANRLMVSILQ